MSDTCPECGSPPKKTYASGTVYICGATLGDWGYQRGELFDRSHGCEIFKVATKLAEALEPYIDDEDCRYDHHGYCQTHGLSDVPCEQVQARGALVEFRTMKGTQ